MIVKEKINMNILIIDAANENICFMIINNNDVYNVTYQNSKTNYEKLVILLKYFLNSKNLEFKDISRIYVNKGPGSFGGIRNSLSIVKAIHLVNKIDYYCYSFKDFHNVKGLKYQNIPNLCDKFKVKKNLINPIYLS